MRHVKEIEIHQNCGIHEWSEVSEVQQDFGIIKIIELIESGKSSKHRRISRVGRVGGVDSEGGRLGSFSWITGAWRIQRIIE
jgi:hypothetical protein